MSNLSIRKKSINTWLHTDSVFGDFIISKFYFNSFFAKFQIVEEGNARLEKYEIANITLYDDTDGGVAETFTNITELSLRLEELQYPAFDRVGTSVFPSMEQITNVNVTDIEDGQVLAWDVATSKWVNITIGGLTTPTFDQVTFEGSISSRPFGFDDGAGAEVNIVPNTVNITSPSGVGNYNVNGIQYQNSSFSTDIVPPATPIADVTFEHPAKTESTYYYATQSEIINANKTAENDSKYTVIANATFTDPTPVEGKGYTVFVRNGTATIGGVGYTAGSLVYRVYYSGAWGSYNQSGFIPITGTTTGNEVTGMVEFRPEILDFKNPAITTNKSYSAYLGIGVQDDELPYLEIVDTTVGTTNGTINLSTSGLTYSVDFTTVNSIDLSGLDGIEITTESGAGLYAQVDFSEVDDTNKLVYAQRSYVDNELKPIVVSTSVTATLNRVHNVVATATLTDPTPTEGMGYPVNVINGTATIGGVGYTAGSLVYRFY